MGVNQSRKSYQVQYSRGNTYTRGRELLRKRIRPKNQEQTLTPRQSKETDIPHTTEQKNAGLQLRRSARLRGRSLENPRKELNEAAS